MKKFVLAVAAVLVATGMPTSASANTTETIAIIDSYFVPSRISGPITLVCVADRGCNDTPTNVTAPVHNHGTQMANVVRRYKPNAHLVLVRAGSIVSGRINDANGREIANAFLAVPASATTVSISIYSNGNGTLDGTGCRPSTQTVTGTVVVSTELTRTTNAVNALASRGTVIFGAAGNANRPTGLNYPACLNNVQSVTMPFLTGTANPNTDLFLRDSGSTLVGLLATTSGATAYVAANASVYGALPRNTYKTVTIAP